MSYKDILRNARQTQRVEKDDFNAGNRIETGDASDKIDPPKGLPRETKTQESTSAHSTALELDLVLRGGDHWGFQYAYKPVMHFDASGIITLYFMNHTVTIKGRNLLPIFQALLDHSAREISEQETEFDSLPDGATAIDSIKVKAK